MLKKGFAKTFFSDVFQSTPWLSSDQKKEECRWPYLDALLKQKKLSYLDYVLSHKLLRNDQEVDQEVPLFLCHLSLAAKEGHLCVRITNGMLNPSVHQLWRDEEGHPLASEEMEKLTTMVLKGAEKIPYGIITTLKQNLETLPQTPICRELDNFYLQRYWIFETLFLKSLKVHLKTPPTLTLKDESIEKSLKQEGSVNILLEEQAQAVKQGCLNALTLIIGGPGTGKTYTAGQLIKVFWDNLSEEQRTSCQIVLAAPTGKAAANLQKSLSRVANSLEGFPPIQAKTLHSLLGIKSGSSIQQSKRLTADLVIVDESSMIDVRVMAALFDALKPGSRLIMLGDKHQLPSVEAGSVFVDLIHLQHSYPDLNIPCVALSKCLRAELKELIDFAHLVNRGMGEEVVNLLNSPKGQGIKRLSLSPDKKNAQNEFLVHVIPHFPSVINPNLRPEELLDLFQSIRLLSPIRKGPFGVEALNSLIWQKLCQKMPMNGWMAIPIIVVMNDYRQELFNGETGVLIRKLPLQSAGREDYALFPSKHEESRVRRIAALALPKYEFAYCLSVHKSQGSEFDRVILALPEGSELFGREVFYTAITRAKKSIEIYGADSTILKTVMQQGLRLSGIVERLSFL